MPSTHSAQITGYKMATYPVFGGIEEDFSLLKRNLEASEFSPLL
jgi:hypothetical protein